MHDLVIHDGELVSPLGVRTGDVAIDGERIACIGSGLVGRQMIDASGKYVFPGVIDAHTHMNLPVAGTRTSDTWETGTRAASCGGVTTLVDFTVGHPGVTIPEAIDRRLAEMDRLVIDVALHGEVIGWKPGQEDEFREAIERGVTSFKFFTAYEASGRRTPPAVMVRAMEALQRWNAVAVVHAEDEALITSIEAGFTAEDRARMSSLADARPALCEQSAIQQVGRIARETGCRTHIVHVSSAAGLEAVREAKQRGADISAETCPQYLLLTRAAYEREEGHLYSASPALRTPADNDSLWEGLRTQSLDFVATDHCPFTREQKTWSGDYARLPYGLPGVETLLPLVFSEGVVAGRLALTDIPRLLSAGPARCHGLASRKGALEPGQDADVVVFDPESTWRLSSDVLHMNTDFSPYEGLEITGRVDITVARGEVVYRGGETMGAAGRGRFVAR